MDGCQKRSDATDLKDILGLALSGTTLFERLELARSRVGFHLFQKRHARAARGKVALNLGLPSARFDFSKPVRQLAAFDVTEMLNFLLDGLQSHDLNLT